MDQNVGFEIGKWIILKSQNWILPTSDSFLLITSHICLEIVIDKSKYFEINLKNIPENLIFTQFATLIQNRDFDLESPTQTKVAQLFALE